MDWLWLLLQPGAKGPKMDESGKIVRTLHFDKETPGTHRFAEVKGIRPRPQQIYLTHDDLAVLGYPTTIEITITAIG
jgi:hypothetical protein